MKDNNIYQTDNEKTFKISKIIEKKQNKKELTLEEIEYFIKEYTNNNIADYQAAALIMAIYINGLTKKETTNLTICMANSGNILNFSEFGDVVDKHSTGGVGDKVTLILMPIIASLGIPVAKMSGRGLGFTGGTADKLESIPGYKTEIDIEQFKQNIKKIKISLITQNLNLAPADKKIYSLRDSISCVDSIPLIASSIMSKKIASGANKLVIDVTCGNGAFMKNKLEAIKLSKAMIEIGNLSNLETVCVITDMSEPLGKSVGNILEVKEAIETLNGNMEDDVKEVILELGAYMLKLAGKGDNIEENKKVIIKQIENGQAYNKFLELVENQGGDISYIQNIEKFSKAKYIIPVVSNKTGYINQINAQKVGEFSVELGAGRIKKDDEIDKTVGIILEKKVGDYVEKLQIMGYIHSNNEQKGIDIAERLKNEIQITSNIVIKSNKILDIVK